MTRQELVDEVYQLLAALPRFDFTVQGRQLPASGIYAFYERGELLPDGRERIVRIGTHNADGNFPGRIRQHYGKVNSLGGHKNGSIFRKHVGAALLRRDDPSDWRLAEWLRTMGDSYAEVEARVSQYFRDNFSFVCFPVATKEERLGLERGLIALLSQQELGASSQGWLGHHAFAPEIARSGLWNVQKVDDQPLTGEELGLLRQLTERVPAV